MTIQEWLAKCQSEVSSPDELRLEAFKLDKIAPRSAMLLRIKAAQWAAKISMKTSKHWSAK